MGKNKDTVLVCKDVSLTKQSFQKECDINHIMVKFKKTAGADFLSQFSGYTGGRVGDFSKVTDYRSAIEQVRTAQGMFDALPAKVRARFRNDTAEFLDFVHNPANREEMISLGLINPSPENPKNESVKTA